MRTCRLYCIRASFVILITSTFQACGLLYPNRMMDTSKDTTFNTFLDTVYHDFTIESGDMLELYVFPNGGYNLIEAQIVSMNANVQTQTYLYSLQYSVDANGMVNIPRAGAVALGGLTELQAEQKLTTIYSEWYNDVFVNIYIKNKFATVYRGSTESKRIELNRPDITILEAIGMAGGLPETGKASHVKIIRNVNGADQVQMLDLSDIASLSSSTTFVQPGDIIYIEPTINSQFFKEVAPIISTFTGIAVIYAFFVNLGN